MNTPLVYVALQQFCEVDDQPRRALLEAGVEVRENPLGRRLRREEMTTLLQGADAVLAGVEPYDGEILAALPRLRCISRCGAGTDSIDLEAARRYGIAVYTTPEEVVEPVAQLTLAMIFALARHVPAFLHDMREGRWQRRTGRLLSEWTMGVVGFGRIGRRVWHYLRPFGARVLVTDPLLKPGEVPEGVERHDLASLLAQADVVSLHVSRRPEQGPLLGPQEFAQMKPGSFVVNTSRGFLVDEEALYRALLSGHLAGAALDVFEREPYTGPLTRLPQVICTPHIGSLTVASRAAMEWRCAQNVVECLLRNQADTAASIVQDRAR